MTIRGFIDEHLTLGDGRIDWNMFAYLTGKLKSKPDIVFELLKIIDGGHFYE